MRTYRDAWGHFERAITTGRRSYEERRHDLASAVIVLHELASRGEAVCEGLPSQRDVCRDGGMSNRDIAYRLRDLFFPGSFIDGSRRSDGRFPVGDEPGLKRLLSTYGNLDV